MTRAKLPGWIRAIVPALLASISAPLSALEQDTEFWLKGGAAIGLSQRDQLELDVESRFSDASGGLYEVELGSLLTRQIAPGLAIGGGYVRAISYAGGSVTRTEDRLRAHVGISGEAGALRLSGRMRLEYRLRSDGDDAGFRLRPQVKARLPVGAPFDLTASHESFIALNDTDWGERAGWRRMRNFAGIVWPVSETASLEAGYLNQWDFVDRAPDRMGHILSISFTLGL